MASSSRSLKFVFLVLYLLNCFILWIGCLGIDTVSLSQQVTDGQTLVSAGDVFELGFFSPDNLTDARYVGMWYKKHGGRIVWVANRENPVMDLSGVLMIGDDGNLIVQDGKKSIIWSTHVNATSKNTIAVLSDIGNLVLKENRSNGLEFWDSFGHPSETLVPRMKIGLDGKTDTKIYISSWKSSADPSQGSFTLSVDGQELPQITIWNGSHKHYRTGQWNGRNFIGLRYLNNDYTSGFALVADGVDGTLSFNFASFDNSRPRLIYLNPSGSFELLDWVAGEKQWKEIRAIPNSPCDIYGACGSFGRCNDDEWSTICRCLTGYEPRNMNEWNKENWKGGCLRRQQFKCETNTSINVEEDGFLEYPGTKLPDLARHAYAPDKSSCEALCLGNCSCTAYAYVDSIGCMLWEKDLIDIQSYSFGGENLYVRLSHSELGKAGGKKISKPLLIVFVSSAILVSGILLYIIYRWRSKQGGGTGAYLNVFTSTNKKISPKGLPAYSFRQGENAEVPNFSLKEMEDATENFAAANKLGEGGFGSVYKGKLSTGQQVAVKRLSSSSGQGIKELKNEVILISKLQHRNLVNLIGYCIQEEEKLLVYEYMCNKSLDRFIFGSNNNTIVDWNMKYNIIEGIARGILYLHRDSRLKIIHRDLKTSNILLDEEMTPKISDFGMARIFGGRQATANTNRVVGTYGYMSPEYAMHGIFSEKSDVFSFGVVLLEIVTGSRNAGLRYHSDVVHLPSHVWKLWNEGKAMELLDPRVVESCNLSQVLKCIQIGLLCVQDYEIDRPAMATIVSMLSSDLILPIPEQPVFSIKPKINLEERDPSMQEWPKFSRNSISQTSIVGR